MTHPVPVSTLSTDEIQLLQLTAEAWRARGYDQTADNLLLVAGLASPRREPSGLPSNVYRLSDYRRSRRQAVS
jgi:hypothetical protein